MIQSIFTLGDLYLSHPLPQRVSFIREITLNSSSVLGSIELLFYTPPSYVKILTSAGMKQKHPLLVNFHGGGFTIGHAGDDARWATAVASQTSAVVVSVNYRLAPEHPFPIGIEDCVSAVLWLWKHAEEYNLDVSKTVFSGFSAGGNLAYAVSIRLHEEFEKMKREKKREFEELQEGKLLSLVVFYGSVDWTQSRAERDASNLNLVPTIPAALFRIFDESYLYAQPDMRSPLLSPGLAPELLRDNLPDKLVIISCGGDQLLAETERFRKRLVNLGKVVEGYAVEGVGHGWDKNPTFKKGDVKRDEVYELAVKSLQHVWA
jgi:acetyl esterase/lipase